MADIFEPFDGVHDAIGQRHPRRPRGREPSRMPLTMREGMEILNRNRPDRLFLNNVDRFVDKLKSFSDWEQVYEQQRPISGEES